MKTVVALPGEGIGIECVDATCELLAAAGLPLKVLTPPQGAAALKTHGTPLPDETKQAARQADGVLFGAAGPTTTAVVSWLRWEMGAWAGVRPEMTGDWSRTESLRATPDYRAQSKPRRPGFDPGACESRSPPCLPPP